MVAQEGDPKMIWKNGCIAQATYIGRQRSPMMQGVGVKGVNLIAERQIVILIKISSNEGMAFNDVAVTFHNFYDKQAKVSV